MRNNSIIFGLLVLLGVLMIYIITQYSAYYMIEISDNVWVGLGYKMLWFLYGIGTSALISLFKWRLV